MTPLGIALRITSAVVSTGVGAVVGNAIKASTPATANLFQKVSIGIGGFVLSGMVAEKASTHVEKTVKRNVKKIKKMFKEKPSTNEEAQD